MRALRPLPLAALLGSIALGGAAHAGAWTTAGMVGGGNSAQLLQSSGSALLSPTTATAPSGTTVSFNVSGGTGSYSWSMLANLSGGSIAPGDASDALYTAGPVNGIQDIIQVTDSSGATATATITVPGPTQHATCSATATVYTPAENTSGVVMFEDNWPANGDLDFNDQLIAYNYEFSLDPSGTYVQEMIANLSVLAAGAAIHNGISLHLPLSAGTSVTAVETLNGQSITLSPSANPNDTDLIFPLIADTRSLFTRQDTFINTSTSFATQTGNSITVTLTFTSPVQLDPSLAPYDLFIAQTEHPSHEIHLPQYAGTASMDTTLFNTSDDNSSKNGGLHFINGNGLPFALTLPDVIAWPQETVAIDRVYESITAFGSSGGAYNLDWYASASATGLAFTAGLGGTLPPAPTTYAVLAGCYNSCAELQAAQPSLTDGTYTLSMGGEGSAVTVYCDFTGGGWTMVENQVPSALLPDDTGDVYPANFGSNSLSWRLGNATVIGIVPTVAWKLTDASNTVYFKPTCVVDWTHDYSPSAGNSGPSDCTTGYYDTGFTNAVNGGWIPIAGSGIGVNDSGQFCSIRAFAAPDAAPVGAMFDCNGDTGQTVSLWFK